MPGCGSCDDCDLTVELVHAPPCRYKGATGTVIRKTGQRQRDLLNSSISTFASNPGDSGAELRNPSVSTGLNDCTPILDWQFGQVGSTAAATLEGDIASGHRRCAPDPIPAPSSLRNSAHHRLQPHQQVTRRRHAGFPAPTSIVIEFQDRLYRAITAVRASSQIEHQQSMRAHISNSYAYGEGLYAPGWE